VEQNIVDRIKADKRVEYICPLDGDRHVLKVPVNLIEEHNKLTKVRGASPQEVDLLTKSMARTGNTSIYPVCLHVEGGPADVLKYFVADGHQRLRAARANGLDSLTCLYIGRWRTAEDALQESVQLQYARYEPQDRDLLSLAKLMSVKELADFTGKSETTLNRFAAVAEHEWFWPPIEDAMLGYSSAARLLKACNKNPDKLAALENTIKEKHEWAKAQAKKWKDKLSQRKRDWDKRSRDKTKVATYFKGFKWSDWVALLEADDGIVKGEDGRLHLRLDAEKPKGVAVRIGDEADWEKQIAVYNFFEAPVAAVTVEDIDEFLVEMPFVEQMLQAIRARKLREEGRIEHPLPTRNPAIMPATPPEPEPQQSRMKVGRRPKSDA
jgi:hypothetical protein